MIEVVLFMLKPGDARFFRVVLWQYFKSELNIQHEW